NLLEFLKKKKMRAVSFVVLLAVVAFASAGYVQPHYEPQDIYMEPNCAVVNDHSRMFRDISDPTHYWVCPEGKEKACYIQCPANEAFMEPLQKCVLWSEWRWMNPIHNKFTYTRF
ncbi:hypothetical protein DOY81_010103, partial [Sarcophaga bullata]